MRGRREGGTILLGHPCLGPRGCSPGGGPGIIFLLSGCCALRRSGHIPLVEWLRSSR